VDGGGPDGSRLLHGGGGVREQYGCCNPKREALRGDIHREGEEDDSAQRLPAGEASDGVGARMRWTAMAPHGGELRRRSWVVAQGGSGHGRRQFVPKGNKKENPAWAASTKKWRGSGAGNATRRKEEGRGTCLVESGAGKGARPVGASGDRCLPREQGSHFNLKSISKVNTI
jgi:hypothetical protein